MSKKCLTEAEMAEYVGLNASAPFYELTSKKRIAENYGEYVLEHVQETYS